MLTKHPHTNSHTHTNTTPQTLVAAIDAVGLKPVLNNKLFKGTVFAPTNAAFELLFKELNTTGAALLKNKVLVKAVLEYHIIEKDVLYRSSLSTLQSWDTSLPKQTITLYVPNKPAKVRVYYGKPKPCGIQPLDSIQYTGFAAVLVGDVKADRAVVQVIDRVLIPTLAPLGRR